MRDIKTPPLWWCAEAQRSARLLVAGSTPADEALSAQVASLQWQVKNLEEALRVAEALDARVLQILEQGGLDRAELVHRARALQRLSYRRSQALVQSFLREGAEAAARTSSLCEAASALGLVGRSPALLQVIARSQLAARSREPVLIAGESGVGKELVARAVHLLSGDPHHKFVAVNCAGIPPDLMESELFGHRRGAFTGALRDHPGLIRAASGGTLFLDELTELPPAAQAKLLRVIQEQRVRGVGETQETRVAVRFVASTNRPLSECLHGGLLRRDLYYRLHRVLIQVPPLRERLEDLPLLVEHFISRWRGAYPWLQAARIDRATLQSLGRHSWPGNVRELENVVFAACAAGTDGLIVEAERLVSAPALAPESLPAPLPAPVPAPEPLSGASGSVPVSLREAEQSAIRHALAACEGNKSQASRVLGISRKQLYVKLRLYGLPV